MQLTALSPIVTLVAIEIICGKGLEMSQMDLADSEPLLPPEEIVDRVLN